MHKAVLADDVLICRHAAECKSSALRQADVDYYEAQLSYIGSRYDLSWAGRDLRVLIVAMEGGGPAQHVTLDIRSEQVRARIPQAFGSRNPHMRGVTLALQLAFGLPAGRDEWLRTDAGPTHVLDAYAMANLLLCSAVRGMTSSCATATMHTNCTEHLVKTIEVLQPTLVINQGVNVGKVLRSVFDVGERLGSAVHRATCAGSAFVWVDLYHPTHWWDWLSRPYLNDVAVPAITLARQALLDTDVEASAAAAPPRSSRAPAPEEVEPPDISTENIFFRRRLAFIPNPEERRLAAERFANGEPIAQLAREYGLTPVRASYCLRQELVCSGQVAPIDPGDRAAVKQSFEHEGLAWALCRTGVSPGRLRELVEESAEEPTIE